MTSVETEFCVPCGFLERADDRQHVGLSSVEDRLESVALVTGENGGFEKSETAFDAGEIVQWVRDRL